MDLLEFLEKSPSAYQAVDHLRALLEESGAAELKEGSAWKLKKDTVYYAVRNDSALIAFCVPEGAEDFRVYAAHADSPSYKLKENPEMVVENAYVKLNVEGYGGMIANTWLDRPLTVAGRLTCVSSEGLVTKNVYLDEDLCVIPNVAVHMNRQINDGYAYNPQTDMLPLLGGMESKGSLMRKLAAEAGVKEEDILGHDLYLVPRQKPVVWGSEKEYFSAGRIDDLECAFAGLEGFLAGNKKKHISVLAVFDNEEVGSGTRQGAASTFLSDVIERMAESFGFGPDLLRQYISRSFLASADNGHAVHPNHPEKTDPTNRPVLNGGVLLKYAASQSYTTDGYSAAVFKSICRQADVPYQIFFNRSDMRGGSTLGNIAIRQIPFCSADIGLAQLSMHSTFETAGMKDYDCMKKFVQTLFE